MMIKPSVNTKDKTDKNVLMTVEEELNYILNLNKPHMIFTFIRNIGIMLAGVMLAVVAFIIYWMSANSDVIGKAVFQPEEIRAMYSKCKIEKVYLIK